MQGHIEAALAAGHITVLQAQQALSALGVDPSSLTIPCEGDGCTQTMRLGDAHSFLSVYAVTGPRDAARDPVPSFLCPHEQHYGCSVQCAAQAHARCIREHMTPILHAVQAGTVTIEQGKPRVRALPEMPEPQGKEE